MHITYCIYITHTMFPKLMFAEDVSRTQYTKDDKMNFGKSKENLCSLAYQFNSNNVVIN